MRDRDKNRDPERARARAKADCRCALRKLDLLEELEDLNRLDPRACQAFVEALAEALEVD